MTSWFRTAAALLMALVAARPAAADPLTVFTDWTLIDLTGNVATGTLAGVGVTFSGTDLNAGVSNGTFTGFNSAFFTPPLAASDVVQFLGSSPAFAYTFTFSGPVTDPILQIQSLASNLDFGGLTIIRLSGEADFLVSGSTVSGVIHGSVDSGGTIQLLGDFTTLSFTADYTGPGGIDGINIQVGTSAVPEPGTLTLVAAGLVWGARRRAAARGFLAVCLDTARGALRESRPVSPSSRASTTATRIPVDIRRLPWTSRFAADYAFAFDKVAPFFAGNPADPAAWRDAVGR